MHDVNMKKYINACQVIEWPMNLNYIVKCRIGWIMKEKQYKYARNVTKVENMTLVNIRGKMVYFQRCTHIFTKTYLRRNDDLQNWHERQSLFEEIRNDRNSRLNHTFPKRCVKGCI